MQTQEASFYSDGLKLNGNFFLPDSIGSEPQPLIITCSGFTGLCGIHPARFARYLTAKGHLCFGFDYRGFAASEGPSGRVILEEQVRDIIHATTYAATDPRVDSRRVVLIGWGMGAGLVLDAARHLHCVIGIAALNGFYNGQRMQLAHRGQDGHNDFCAEVAGERVRRVRTGKMARIDPFHLYPLDAQSRSYVDGVLRNAPNYAAEAYAFELADSLLRWHPEAHAPYMRIPLLIAHGDRNKLHPVEEAESLFRAYGGPKQLYWIEGGGHTEWMLDDHPRFQALGARLASWLDGLLGSG